MTTWAGLVGVAVLAAADPDPGRLAVSPAETRAAERAVGRLGGPSFAERERATRELARLGRRAVGPLRAAADSPSAEVRGRVRALLAVAADADAAARLDGFALDRDGRFEHGVPGWSAFKAAAGTDPAARRLFVAMARVPANGRLLAALPDSPGRPAGDELAAAVAARRSGVRYGQMLPGAWKLNGPVPADMAAVLLGETALGTDAPPFGLEYPTGNYFGTAAGRQALLGQGEFGPAYRRLADAWLESRTTPQGVTAAFNAANNALPPADVARYAGRVVQARGAQPYARAGACLALARLRAADQLPALAAAMSDQTVVQPAIPGTQQGEIRVADCALVAALVLTGQKPADYGFSGAGTASHPGAYTLRDGPGPDSPTARPAADKRAAALARWDRWAAATRGGLAGGGAAAGPDPRTAPAGP